MKSSVLLILTFGALCACAFPTTDTVVPEEAVGVASHWYDAARADEPIPSEDTDFLETALKTQVVPEDSSDAKVLDAIASMLAYCQLAYEKAKEIDDDKQSSLAGFIVAYGGAADPDKVQPVSPAVYNAAVIQVQTLYGKGIGKYLFDYVDSAVKSGEIVIGPIATNRIGFQYKKLGLTTEPTYFQALGVRATAYQERLAAIKAHPSPTACCKANTPTCMACAAGMTVEHFCRVYSKKCFPDMDDLDDDAEDEEAEEDDAEEKEGSDCKDDDAGLKSQSLGMIADCSTAMLGGKTTVCNYEPTKPNQEHAKLVTGHCQKSCGLCEAVQVKESKVDFEIKQEDSGNDDVGDVLKAQLEDPKSTLYEGDTTNKVVASKSVVTIPTLAPTAAPTASPTEAPSSAPTSFPTMAPTVNMEESARWVDVINYYRCLHGVPKVEWDNGMATSAQAWAESLNALKHDDTFHLPPPAGPAGENLARGQRKLEDAAKQWYSEISKCPKEAQLAPQAASLVQIGGAKPGGTKKMATMENQAALMQASGVPPAEKIKPGCDVDITKVGHFTAMVWKAAKKIGCGIHATRKIYVCRFKAGDELKGGETPNYGGRAFYDQNILPNSKTDQECPKPELAKGPLDVTCDDTAQDTLDEIEASVKAQQDALDLMDKGENCGSAGDDLIAATQHEKEKAAGLVLQSHAKVAAAEATTISMGSYTWKELVVDECENLFGDQYYAVSQSVTAAKNELGQDEGRLKAAKKAVERAPAEAALLVTQCQCEARHQHQEAVKAMNKEVEEVNTKAWKEAKLMLCTIKGVSSANCDTSGMPVVKPTTLAEGVADAFCAGLPFEGALGARNGVPAHKYVFQLEQPDYANNAANSYTTQAITQCAKHEMLPVCDHPSYCKDDGRSMYIGQDSHLSVQSVRENATPTGFAAMKEHWDGVCYYTSNANGPHALCATDGGGNPSSGHAWMRPSTLLNKDSKYFMCARIVHKSFTVSLGARNGVPAQTVQFRMITARNKGTGEINRNMLADCGLIGMKPVCDHPSYCKGDQDSFYVGQDHHFSHGPHRRSLNYFPAGWDKFLEHEQEMPGMCTYTAHHNGWASTLCGNPDSHAWRTSAQNHEFLCAKKVA